MKTKSFRLAGVVLAAGAGLLLGSGLASADAVPGLAAPSTADVSAAHTAATAPAVQATAGRFLAGGGQPGLAAAAPVTPTMGRTVAVYYLNPEFITTGTSVPVATQAFLATEAKAPNGHTASVWTVRKGNTWTEINIASGSNEFVYADKAAAVSPNAKAFYEPQIHAWYALAGDKVVGLNADATKSIGAESVSIAEYQHVVNARYADKMPNTPYGKNHMVGGINTTPDVSGGPKMIAAPARPAESNSAPLIGAVAGVGLLGAAGLYLRRRRANA